MKLNRRALVVLALISIFAAGVVGAQWPTSSATPLVVADRTGAQVQAKIAAIADGGFYISWFDNSTGGYDVYLQRLDAAGNEMWAHNGVLVADRDFSSTQDYGLGVDSTGNALLAFRDDRGGPTDIQITVTKVLPDGSMPWGPGGVQVSSGSAFVAAPHVSGTSDGNLVVAWSSDFDVMVQNLDADGAPQWGGGITFTPPSGELFAASDVHDSGAGTAIVSFIHRIGSFGAPIHIRAQKLAAADGASLWDADHVAVFSGGSLQFGNFPPFVSDGAGGAVFAWYTSSPSLQVRVQRILSNGTEAFASQGVEVSTNATRVRVGPEAAFNLATQETFVAWTEQTSNQSQDGVYAQKLDATGVRQWTDDGKALMPISTDQVFDVGILTIGDGAMVTWIHSPSFGNDPIYSIRVDADGGFAWIPPIAEICILPTESSRLVGVMGAGGFAAYAWSDGGSGDGDIYSASLNGDGILGDTGSLFSDGFESGDTTVWSSASP